MATDFPIRVVVDPSGAKRGTDKVKRELGSVEKKASDVGRTIKRAFAGIAASLGVREIVRLGDAYTELQNRLRTVTSSSEQLADATNEVFAIANRTRQSVSGVALAFQRFSSAAEGVGLSQAGVLELTESVNQALALSGSSSQEATAALIQFSQGLGAGALRGEEFNSVMEGGIEIAKVIANELGVNTGQLRMMAAEGKLTAEVIVRAFQNAREELSDRFGKSVPTVNQAMTQLRNNLIRMVGELQKATNVFGLLASAIGVVGGVLTTLGRALGRILGGVKSFVVAGGNMLDSISELAAIILVPLIPAVEAATGVFGTFTAGVVAMLALNPVAWVAAFGVAVAAFHDELVDATVSVLDFMDSVLPFTDAVETATITETIWFRNALKANEALIEQGKAAKATAEFWDAYGSRVKLAALVTKGFVKDALNPSVSALRNLAGAIGIIARDESQIVKTRSRHRDVTRDLTEDTRDLNDSLRRQAELEASLAAQRGKLGIAGRPISGILKDAETDFIRNRQAERDAARKKSVADQEREQKRLQAIEQARLNAMAQGLADIGNQFIDAAFAGDQSFGEFFSNFFRQMTKAIAKALLLKGIMEAFDIESEGSAGGIAGILGLASGGSFEVGGTGGTDSQLVAFRATPGERVSVHTPEQLQRGEGGGATSVNVKAVIVRDERSAMLEAIQSPEGERAIVTVLDRVRR